MKSQAILQQTVWQNSFLDSCLPIIPELGIDKACEFCVRGQSHTLMVHDVYVNRSIKPERRNRVINFRRRLHSLVLIPVGTAKGDSQ